MKQIQNNQKAIPACGFKKSQEKKNTQTKSILPNVCDFQTENRIP
jgi:hypothetical protein